MISLSLACVMNFATFEKAYSLYPAATFERRTSLICNANSDTKRDEIYQKWRTRGWVVQNELPFQDMTADYHSLDARPRRVGDKHCWTISLQVDCFPPELLSTVKANRSHFNDPSRARCPAPHHLALRAVYGTSSLHCFRLYTALWNPIVAPR